MKKYFNTLKMLNEVWLDALTQNPKNLKRKLITRQKIQQDHQRALRHHIKLQKQQSTKTKN